MKAVITGDITNSRKVAPAIWVNHLRGILSNYGNEPKDWEIYRGDSFQLITSIESALEIAFIIKATIKQHKLLDVRMAIGIGDIVYNSHKITESNGDAFVNSGECFENLKKNTLAIKTPWLNFNTTFNMILQLVSLTTNDWTTASSIILKKAFENPETNQTQLAKELNIKSQSTISAALKRSGYEEVKNVINFYKSEIKKLC